MHSEQKNLVNEAADLFDRGDFKKAFYVLIEAYDTCNDKENKEMIFSIIKDAYYYPNEQVLRDNYEQNFNLLEKYPFFFGGSLKKFDDLTFIAVPIVDGVFCCYDKISKRFLNEYNPESYNNKYFFEDTVDPIKVEDEDNFFDLKFLNDNVRKSEDVAKENHIYLMYHSLANLERLMLTCDFSNILAQEKFVFLIGEDSFSKYPINFKDTFGIDYEQYTPKEIGPDDVKRMIFGWKIVNEVGTSFLADILDFHPDLLTIPDGLITDFPDYFNKYLRGRNAKSVIKTLKTLKEKDERNCFWETLLSNELDEGKLIEPDKLNTVTKEKFLDKMLDLLNGKDNPTAKDWLICIYLAFSFCRGRTFNGRLVPAIFHYPHNNSIYYIGNINRHILDFYFDIITDFPYYKSIAIMRDPITYIANAMRYATTIRPDALNQNGEIQTDPFYEMAFSAFFPKDFYFPTQHPMFSHTAVVRLEDLKLNPKATLAALGEFLNIPVTDSLFHTTWCGIERVDGDAVGNPISGFDPATIYEDYPDYLSVFDKYRIEMALLPFFKAYGYEPAYYDGQEFTDAQKIMLLQLPFVSESIKTVVSEQIKKAHKQNALNFMKLTIAIKKFPFAISGIDGDCLPILWLRPKEELIEVPIYKTRK